MIPHKGSVIFKFERVTVFRVLGIDISLVILPVFPLMIQTPVATVLPSLLLSNTSESYKLLSNWSGVFKPAISESGYMHMFATKPYTVGEWTPHLCLTERENSEGHDMLWWICFIQELGLRILQQVWQPPNAKLSVHWNLTPWSLGIEIPWQPGLSGVNKGWMLSEVVKWLDIPLCNLIYVRPQLISQGLTLSCLTKA